jgi:hypothetical protein
MVNFWLILTVTPDLKDNALDRFSNYKVTELRRGSPWDYGVKETDLGVMEAHPGNNEVYCGASDPTQETS